MRDGWVKREGNLLWYIHERGNVIRPDADCKYIATAKVSGRYIVIGLFDDLTEGMRAVEQYECLIGAVA